MSLTQHQEDLVAAILAGNVRALARAASAVERQSDAARALLAHLFPYGGQSRVIGVTGPPGAGKSTLVNHLLRHLRCLSHRVAVIAIDPSSTLSNGALLGDRIRMSEHHADPGVFIRSMATRGRLGGLAAATMDMLLLLDAARFDFIFVETAGVGQAEIDIANLADLTMVVLTPESGDHVQALKAGIMEVADLFAINKSDLPGADRLEQQLRFVQHLSARHHVPPPIYRVIASDGSGVQLLMSGLLDLCQTRGRWLAHSSRWLHTLTAMLHDEISACLDPSLLEQHAQTVASHQETPSEAVHALIRATLAKLLNRDSLPASGGRIAN